jgi:hypothetical protein
MSTAKAKPPERVSRRRRAARARTTPRRPRRGRRPGSVHEPGLAAALGGAGVHGAEVTVETVAAVARQPDTGKTKRFVTRPA